jgi:mannose/fructose/N-acetylgalactosamine-specific phosphotransferase system component IIC
VSRIELGIVVGATVGPLALIGLLMLGGHHAPDPAPPAVVKVVPYVPAPAHTDAQEVLA